MEIRLLATLVESHSPKNGPLIALQIAPHFLPHLAREAQDKGLGMRGGGPRQGGLNKAPCLRGVGTRGKEQCVGIHRVQVQQQRGVHGTSRSITPADFEFPVQSFNPLPFFPGRFLWLL